MRDLIVKSSDNSCVQYRDRTTCCNYIAFIETDNMNFECELSKLDEVVTCFVQNGGLLGEAGEEKEHDEIC